MTRCCPAVLANLTAGLLATGLAAGCAALPSPVAPPPKPVPVVTIAQAHRIVMATEDLLAERAAAGQAWDTTRDATRLTGPALQWTAAGPGGQVPSLVPRSGGAATVIAPQAGSWPRAFAVLDSSGSVLSIYVSEAPQLPYRLWATVPIGQPLPDFGPSDAAVTLPGAELAGVIADLPTRYVDVLRDGDRSVHAPEFEADGYAAALRTRVDAEQTRLGTGRPPVVTHEVLRPEGQPDVVFAVVAADGDALAVAAFTTTVTTSPGPSTSGAAAIDGATAAAHWVAAVAFVVPAAQGNIRVVGAADTIGPSADNPSADKP